VVLGLKQRKSQCLPRGQSFRCPSIPCVRLCARHLLGRCRFATGASRAHACLRATSRRRAFGRWAIARSLNRGGGLPANHPRTCHNPTGHNPDKFTKFRYCLVFAACLRYEMAANTATTMRCNDNGQEVDLEMSKAVETFGCQAKCRCLRRENGSRTSPLRTRLHC